MAKDIQPDGPCPKCGHGSLECKHNVFEDDEQHIDTWEHRCRECGYRDTRAFRVAEEEDPLEDDPLVCPMCGRRAEGSE